MFGENLRALRKERGFSQETFAARLKVVRQTVSKWEKGLSVPDAEMLMRIAEVLDTSVAVLLGDTIEIEEDKNAVSKQLEQLNALLAEKNRRSRLIWRIVAGILIAIAAFIAIVILLNVVALGNYSFSPKATITEEPVEEMTGETEDAVF